MSCRKTRKLLSVRFDGELDEVRERAVRKHLAGCPCCQRFAGDLPRCAEALNLITVSEPRHGFTARVMARLPEPGGERVWLRDWLEALRPGPAAAAVLALSCGVAMALSMNGERGSEVSNRKEPAEAIYAQSFDAVPVDSAAARYLAVLEEAQE